MGTELWWLCDDEPICTASSRCSWPIDRTPAAVAGHQACRDRCVRGAHFPKGNDLIHAQIVVRDFLGNPDVGFTELARFLGGRHVERAGRCGGPTRTTSARQLVLTAAKPFSATSWRVARRSHRDRAHDGDPTLVNEADVRKVRIRAARPS